MLVLATLTGVLLAYYAYDRWARGPKSSLPMEYHSYGQYTDKGWFILKKRVDADTLLVFVHGMGGQMSQFIKQMEYFHMYDILAIDLVGCGYSRKSSRYTDFTTIHIIQHLKMCVDPFMKNYKKVVFIGHSYGSHLIIKLYHQLSHPDMSFIMIAPPGPLRPEQIKAIRWLKWLPMWVLDMFRWIDRLGGLYSPSVNRFVSPTASLSVRHQQAIWNRQSYTGSLKPTMMGLSLLTPLECQNIKAPLLVLLAECDQTTPFVHFTHLATGFKSNPCKMALLLKGAAHNIMFEHHLVVNEIIENFIHTCSYPEMKTSAVVNVSHLFDL